jgi:hypothetical protein
VCRSQPTTPAIRVLNCPCCFRNLIVLRAMAVSTLLPSVSGFAPHGDGAPARGALPKRKVAQINREFTTPRLDPRAGPAVSRLWASRATMISDTVILAGC